jgi:hypothetical protein
MRGLCHGKFALRNFCRCPAELLYTRVLDQTVMLQAIRAGRFNVCMTARIRPPANLLISHGYDYKRLFYEHRREIE